MQRRSAHRTQDLSHFPQHVDITMCFQSDNVPWTALSMTFVDRSMPTAVGFVVRLELAQPQPLPYAIEVAKADC